MQQLYLILFIVYGLLIGSFLNVCIYRIPKKENIAVVRSHCMNCGYQLRWFDLIPVISFLVLRGKCRKCGTRLSWQYPLVELANGGLYLIVFFKYGVSVESLLYCLLFSALLTLSVIDFRTYEIPVGINLFILAVGLVRVVTDITHVISYIIGFLSVSMFLYLLYVLTKGRGIGGGDVKLMAVAGLVIGFPNILVAFLLGCIIGSVCHVVRMRVSKADHVLAMGPYLSIGIGIAALFGNDLVQWYLGFLGL